MVQTINCICKKLLMQIKSYMLTKVIYIQCIRYNLICEMTEMSFQTLVLYFVKLNYWAFVFVFKLFLLNCLLNTIKTTFKGKKKYQIYNDLSIFQLCTIVVIITFILTIPIHDLNPFEFVFIISYYILLI